MEINLIFLTFSFDKFVRHKKYKNPPTEGFKLF